MAGGKIRLLWDRDEPAVVNIYGGGGALSTAFTIDGDVVEFPYSLTGDVTLATTKSDTYSLSVKLNDVEIASDSDGQKMVPLLDGSAECVFAPSPKDGFVSPTAGGGAAVTDGVGAVFFGGETLAVAIDNTYVFSPFIATDDPPRAPQRDDLMVIDPETEDDTIINVVQSGLYDISLNVPVQPRDLVVGVGDGPFILEAVIQVWVAGGTQPPAYDYNNRAQWVVTESVPYMPTVFTNWTFPQVLQAGDTIQLAFKATQSGVGTLGGTIHLDPDITFVLTYRGPVAA